MGMVLRFRDWDLGFMIIVFQFDLLLCSRGWFFDVGVKYCVCRVGYLMLMIDGLWYGVQEYSIQYNKNEVFIQSSNLITFHFSFHS